MTTKLRGSTRELVLKANNAMYRSSASGRFVERDDVKTSPRVTISAKDINRAFKAAKREVEAA